MSTPILLAEETEAILGESKNSFSQHINDMQNIPDVKDFFDKDWIQEDSRIRINPTFSNMMSTISADLKIRKNLKLEEDLQIRHRFFGSDQMGIKEIGCRITPDQIKIQYDGGFKPSLKYRFNPYYKLEFYRSPLIFRKAAIGFNFMDSESTTHHEFCVINNQKETALRFKNSFMMTWRDIKYWGLTINTFGNEVTTKASQIISYHPDNRLAIFLGMDTDPSKDVHYTVGFRATANEWLKLFSKVIVDPEMNKSWIAGFQIDKFKDFSGKVAIKNFEEVHAYVSTQRYYSTKMSFVTALPLGKRRTRTPSFGIDISINQ